MHHLPRQILAFDVETTGLAQHDRIVTFGGWLLDTEALLDGAPAARPLHLIVRPNRRCHPMAAKVHGYDDAVLSCQVPFTEVAAEIEAFMAAADLFVAHNAQFDERFVTREFAALGRPMPARPIYCTMEGYRRSGRSGRASLNAVLADLGIARLGTTHGALEDAWLALSIYLWLNGVSATFVPTYADLLAGEICCAQPTNYCDPDLGPIRVISRPSMTASPAAISAMPAN